MRVKHVLVIVVVLALAAGLAVLARSPMSPFAGPGGRPELVLEAMGYTIASVANTAQTSGGHVLSQVTLATPDGAQAALIETATLGSAPGGGRAIVIDGMRLAATASRFGLPVVGGWAPPQGGMTALAAAMKKNKINALSLNAGQIAMAVPLLGTVPLNVKGQITLQDDGALRLQAVLWATQEDIRGEIHVNGEFAANGLASVDFEVADGRIGTTTLAAARMGGWMILNKTSPTAPWAISTQIVAGSARLSALSFNGVTLTLQGTQQDATLTLQAGGASNDQPALAIDAHLLRNGQSRLEATLRAPDFSDLLRAAGGVNDGTTGATKTRRPGAIAIYDARSATMDTLFDQAAIGLSDLNGQVWMKGVLRRVADGAEMDIQQASLQKLAEALGIEEMQSGGLLTGLLPLTRNANGQVAIDQGLMRATSPATLSYTADELPAFLSPSRKDSKSLMKSFAYDQLEMFVSGPVAGPITGDITLTGKPAPNQKPVRMIFGIGKKDTAPPSGR